MVTIEDYGEFETAWCPGCGNFSILKALKKALVGLGLAPHEVLMVSGIGQAAKSPHYLRCKFFNGLHGRSLPAAQAAKLANPDLTVIAESGDGCNYGEGGNHFLAALRRNVDMALLAHDNQIYGLTKGQASPTTQEGQITKANPGGVTNAPFNPIAVAVAMRANFVARGFSGQIDHLAELIQQAVRHPGFALVDILQPCVSFNKINTFGWYKERVYNLGDEHDPTSWEQALAKSQEFGDKIPLGVIWKNDRQPLNRKLPQLEQGALCTRPVPMDTLRDIVRSFA
jgi:2-oxoglutarate/2-oxoacid ferredoxin oxidoreductase subunit beta